MPKGKANLSQLVTALVLSTLAGPAAAAGTSVLIVPVDDFIDACPLGSGIPSPHNDDFMYRVGGVIQELRNENLEDSLLHLHWVDGYYNPGPSIQSWIATELDDLRYILSNRRVAKVLEELDRLPAKEQRWLLGKYLSYYENLHAETFASRMAEMEEGSEQHLNLRISDTSTRSPTVRGVTLAWGALNVISGLLGQTEVIAEHASPEKVEQLRSRAATAKAAHSELRQITLGRAGIVGNAHFLAATQRKAVAADSKLAGLEGRLRASKNLVKHRLLPYDAEFWQTDLAYRLGARLADDSRVLRSFELLDLDRVQLEAVHRAFYGADFELPPAQIKALQNNPLDVPSGGPILFRRNGVNMQQNGHHGKVWLPQLQGWDGHNTGAGNRFEHVHIVNNYPINGITSAEVKAYWDWKYQGYSFTDGNVDVAQNCHGYSTGLGTWVQKPGMVKILADDYTRKNPQCPEPGDLDWFATVNHSEKIVTNCPGCDCVNRPQCCFVCNRILKDRDSPVYAFTYFCPGGGLYKDLYK